MADDRTILCELGWCVARLGIDGDGLATSLTLISPADTTEGRYAPVESVCIYKRENIVKLRKFLVENIQLIEQHEAVSVSGADEQPVSA